nr:hypothetical protein [Escherichia coli]
MPSCFDSNAQTLMGGGRLTVTVIRENGEEQMANVNKIVRRRQLALFIALVLGIGGGWGRNLDGIRDEPEESPAGKSTKGRTCAGYDRGGQSVL